ncbi:hypothetical protein PILCRDRAFT_17212 [Piloderma croceum F 1598]|uniref:DUF6534 domain-containing protein n=1 Tax=Piloderma croceum (strain F 1598) TaxID=765440 RepID=A0A0C3ET55_PILCF|nr:hypothetical protein PILCRDRAFT_17212 [Piloderma croceum F 1598]
MPESFTNTFGMMLIAFSVDLILYGVGLLLVFQYYRAFYSDPMWPLKIMVAAMIILMTTQVGSFFAWVYWDLIVNFGNIAKLDIMVRTALVQLLAIYITAFVSQCFYASRVWRLSHGNVWMTGFIMTLALLQISAGIAQTTLSGQIGVFSLLFTTKTVTTIQSGATAACDLSITVLLCWVLHGSRTGVRSTDALLDKLITYAINRGALTTLAAFLNMLLFVLRPEAFIFMVPLLCSGQLYVISVVTTLNCRGVKLENSSHLHSLGVDSLPMSSYIPGNKSGTGVHVTKSIVTWTEDEDQTKMRSRDPSVAKSSPAPLGEILRIE